ncbi:ribonuclease P [Malassezia pachydermatis]
MTNPVRLVRLAPAAFQPPSSMVMMHRPPLAQYRCTYFNLNMYPLRSPPTPTSSTTRMPPMLGPTWLPYPPTSSTHEPRHLRRYAAYMNPSTVHTPQCHVAVMIGKKRVHKHAVVRNRCRTRLLAALQALLQEDRLPALPIHSDVAYVLVGTASIYYAPWTDLQRHLRRALNAVSTTLSSRARS